MITQVKHVFVTLSHAGPDTWKEWGRIERLTLSGITNGTKSDILLERPSRQGPYGTNLYVCFPEYIYLLNNPRKYGHYETRTNLC